MNWDKAKNLTIIFLVVLNVLLVVLVYGNTTKYILTQEQERAIFKVMKQNNIGLYSTIPKEYSPMAQLQMSSYRMDTAELTDIFFGKEQEIKKTLELGKEIIRQGEATLVAEGSMINFENPKGSGAIVLTQSSAKELCNAFVNTHQKNFPGYVLDDVKEKQIEIGVKAEIQTGAEVKEETPKNGFKLEYRQKYKDMLIYSNCITFYVTDKGIVRIEAIADKPVGFDHIKKEILSGDGGLFVFMQQVKDLYGNREAIINKMDMVYYQQEARDGQNTLIKLVPYYRFYIQGEEKPFLINGYTSSPYRE